MVGERVLKVLLDVGPRPGGIAAAAGVDGVPDEGGLVVRGGEPDVREAVPVEVRDVGEQVL
ncbi:hypothetical protein OG883_45875 [Streptomyces sp. NBC_01142]|uniref:hypothetical protein n=1 Tax=Streptomyces sp. NBC_01142 TaxID=2975865 RepID=UPI00225691DA|nr:hypothetical protein [Streptomyces sp. NBC_01142]MCX4826923.1 hypothetical protein [Streptomyces sp. NBC_01142]MCX4826970.1 hypothetical protein [Streptomyces sp. NBC_01142]